MLEVCQFARDASVAEAWLVAQEPYVTSRDLGLTVDEVEKLLKRHEAFEKSTAAWEERFSALERLTTVPGTPLAEHVASRVAAEGREDQGLTSGLFVLFPSSAGVDGSEVAAAGHGAAHQGAALGQGQQVDAAAGALFHPRRLTGAALSLHTMRRKTHNSSRRRRRSKSLSEPHFPFYGLKQEIIQNSANLIATLAHSDLSAHAHTHTPSLKSTSLPSAAGEKTQALWRSRHSCTPWRNKLWSVPDSASVFSPYLPATTCHETTTFYSSEFTD